MYRLIAGDSIGTGMPSLQSVEQCLQLAVGIRLPNYHELITCDFDNDGKIGLKDTLKVLEIVRENKSALYLKKNNLKMDRDIIQGNFLGSYITFNQPITFSSTSDWIIHINSNRLYLETKSSLGEDVVNLGIISPMHAKIVSYDLIFDVNGVMNYVSK